MSDPGGSDPFCPHCGAPVPTAGAPYCNACGNPLVSKVPGADPTKTRRFALVATGAVAAAIALVVIVVVVATRVREPSSDAGSRTPDQTNNSGGSTGGDNSTSPTITSVGKSGVSCESPAPNPKTFSAPPSPKIDQSRDYRATMNTNYGKFTIALYARDAPVTVNNFVSLSCDGFYSGSKFHRLTTSATLSVLQGGDATVGDGTGGPGYKIPDELSRAKQVGYKRGTVAMANTGAPDSGGSQFFIVVNDATMCPRHDASVVLTLRPAARGCGASGGAAPAAST